MKPARTAAVISAISVISLLTTSQLAHARPVADSARKADTTTLPRLLEARNFKPPEQFKALVIALGRVAKDRPLPRPKVYSYHRSAWDRQDWWPASSVKLYCAIAALEVTREHGLRPSARVLFKYDDGDRRGRVSGLVHMALVPSNNLAFDRLCEIVGADRLNRRFFSARNGLAGTIMLRSYFGQRRLASGTGTSRFSPAMVLDDGRKKVEVAARSSTRTYPCKDEGNCTTLAHLAEAARRVMLAERLPQNQRFALGTTELGLLRKAMSTRRKRGNSVVDGLARGFGPGLEFFHKPGYSRRWFSDAVFVRHRRTGRSWVVAMAGYPGRNALDKAARQIGALLKGPLKDP